MFFMHLALLVADPAAGIVVTARPLSSLQADLTACVQRHCPVDADIAATLAYADAAFVAGAYKPARKALSASIGRNRAAAPDHPEMLSELYRAYATVSKHLGEADSYRQGTWNIERTARISPKSTDEERLAARIEVADMKVSMEEPRDALEAYAAISRDAHAAHLAVMAGHADIRMAKMLYAYRRKREARALLIDLTTRPGPDMAAFRLGARLLLQQVDHPGEKPDMAALAADPEGLPDQGAQALIWTPPADANDDAAQAAVGRQTSTASHVAYHEGESFDDTWIDVGFHVNPDGTVQDAQILRSSRGREAGWAKAELARIAGRLYTPLKPGVVSPNADRTERLTFTSRWTTSLDWQKTNIPHRDGIARVERVDLTPDAGPQDAGTPSGDPQTSTAPH